MTALTRSERLDDVLAEPFNDLFRRFFRRSDLPGLRGPAEEARAEFKDGVLTLSRPKRDEGRATTLRID